ncbi:MAG: hypothetical protein U9N59_09015 [Campylobacterota bacterium]|nr:hypothetical protein [Campylobacterota bacterium]
MNNNLLEKLKQSKNKIKKQSKKELNINSKFGTLTNEEIALVVAHRSKKLRISINLKQSEFSKFANLSSVTTYSNFEQTGKISFLNFIKIVRTFNRLNELENLLNPTILQKIEEDETTTRKRVR